MAAPGPDAPTQAGTAGPLSTPVAELAGLPASLTARDTPLNDYLRPLRVGAFAPYSLRAVALPANVPVLWGVANPLRVGLLLSHDGPAAVVAYAGPHTGSAIHPVLWMPGMSLTGGTLGELLSLCGAEWWAISPSDVTLYITEFIRPM